MCSGSTPGDQDSRNTLCYMYEEFEVSELYFLTSFESLVVQKLKLAWPHSLQLTERPDDICGQLPLRTSWIAAFVGDEAIQYFVLVEQKVLCQIPSFQQALFIAFSSFYVFHLEYPEEVKSFIFPPRLCSCPPGLSQETRDILSCGI